MSYYVKKNGQKSGPFTQEKLKELVACGLLNSKDQCWQEGLSDWIPILQAFACETDLQNVDAPPIAFAGFWRRLGAHAIDSVVLNVGCAAFVYCMVWAAFGLDHNQVTDNDDKKSVIHFFVFLCGIILTWLYYACSESSLYQATLGKRVFGFLVTDMDSERITFERASIRYWSMLLSLITLFIGFLMCAWTKKHQCLHDTVSGCLLPLKG